MHYLLIVYIYIFIFIMLLCIEHNNKITVTYLKNEQISDSQSHISVLDSMFLTVSVQITSYNHLQVLIMC
jgi:uncharacterized membrane protein YciS (DUF1049 family)